MSTEQQRILITGAGGQLGTFLRRTAPAGCRVTALTRAALDLACRDAVTKAVERESPHWILNAGAYTAVDAAESDSETAYAVNADGAGRLARAAAANGARMVQVSTDFVFDGSRPTPYRPDATPNPLNVYGASKLAGELAVRDELGARAVIVRTAWVYAPFGGNFVLSLLRLLRQRDHLDVVDDQIGTPTSAEGLAHAVWAVVVRGLSGTFHWTDAGVASWFDFALAVRDEAVAAGLLSRRTPIRPIPAAEFPRPARRPPFSVLDKTSSWRALEASPQHWRTALQAVLRRRMENAA